MANIAYIFMSFDGEDPASQKSMIAEHASAKGFRIDNYITVELPAARRERSRRVKDLFFSVDRWDVIIIADLAVTGNDLSDIVAITGDLLKRGVRFIAARQGVDLNGPGDGSSKAATALFNMLTAVDKEVTSRRIKGVLAQKRNEGVVLGRPKGSISASKLDSKKELIVEYLSKGVSKASLARIVETSPTNLSSYLRTRKIVVAKKDPRAKKDALQKRSPEKEVPEEHMPPAAATVQAEPRVQFQETSEVLLCRHCGKNINDSRTTTCAGGYIDYPNGEFHPRIPYPEDEKERCPRCGVNPGGFHHDGCYMERCPKCGERLVSCGCRSIGSANGQDFSG